MLTVCRIESCSLGLTLMTLLPLKIAIHKLPSKSIVMPSKWPGIPCLESVSMVLRLAVINNY